MSKFVQFAHGVMVEAEDFARKVFHPDAAPLAAADQAKTELGVNDALQGQVPAIPSEQVPLLDPTPTYVMADAGLTDEQRIAADDLAAAQTAKQQTDEQARQDAVNAAAEKAAADADAAQANQKAAAAGGVTPLSETQKADEQAAADKQAADQAATDQAATDQAATDKKSKK